jgi:predicted nucleotidyltransferase
LTPAQPNDCRPRREHTWLHDGSVEVDIIPATAELLACGHMDWPSGHRMDLTGFEHAFRHRRAIAIAADLVVDVADLPVLVLLKVCSYLDRPERTHDLEDFLYLLARYLDGDDERRWDADIVERRLDFDDVGAFIPGRDIAAFPTDRGRSRCAAFLARTEDDRAGTLPLLCRASSRAYEPTASSSAQRP